MFRIDLDGRADNPLGDEVDPDVMNWKILGEKRAEVIRDATQDARAEADGVVVSATLAYVTDGGSLAANVLEGAFANAAGGAGTRMADTGPKTRATDSKALAIDAVAGGSGTLPANKTVGKLASSQAGRVANLMGGRTTRTIESTLSNSLPIVLTSTAANVVGTDQFQREDPSTADTGVNCHRANRPVGPLPRTRDLVFSQIMPSHN